MKEMNTVEQIKIIFTCMRTYMCLFDGFWSIGSHDRLILHLQWQKALKMASTHFVTWTLQPPVQTVGQLTGLDYIYACRRPLRQVLIVYQEPALPLFQTVGQLGFPFLEFFLKISPIIKLMHFIAYLQQVSSLY